MLYKHAHKHLSNPKQHMLSNNSTITDITKLEEFAQYPPLASYILSAIVDEIISKLKIGFTDQPVS